MTIGVIILAAGEGKRMGGSAHRLKVLQLLAKRPLLEHVLCAVLDLPVSTLALVYSGQGQIKTAVQHCTPNPEKILWIHQDRPLGTAHAVKQALSKSTRLQQMQRVLILYGDTPLISRESLRNFIERVPQESVGIITACLSNPTGYGRVVRNAQQQVIKIVEEKDATSSERAIMEVNSGIYLMPVNLLQAWLPRVNPYNQAEEYYLTDIIAIAVAEAHPICTVSPQTLEEIYGVNDQAQLAQIEQIYQAQQIQKLQQQGAYIFDPATFYVRGTVSVAAEVYLDVGVILEGKVNLGSGCVIGPHTYLKNVDLDPGVHLQGYSRLENVQVGEKSVIGPFTELSAMRLGKRVQVRGHSVCCQSIIGDDSVVGPFSHLRPNTQLSSHASIGNFVEIKNSQIGSHSKINHHSYIGDTTMGEYVNMGAGTITCNFDGTHKYPTTISDQAFIGANSALIAPVTIGEGALIGAGSVITQDAPPWRVSLSRAPQQNIKCRKKSSLQLKGKGT